VSKRSKAKRRESLSLAARASTARERIVQGLPSLIRQRNQAIMVDYWTTGRQAQLDDSSPASFDGGKPFIPRNMEQRNHGSHAPEGGREYLDLASRASAPFGKLVISSVAQTIHFTGARIPGRPEDEKLDAIRVLRRNNWDRQQQPHTRANVAHGLAFVSVFPGTDPLSGDPLPRVRAHSAKRVALFFDDEQDEWGSYSIMLGPGISDGDGKHMRTVTVVDDREALQFTLKGVDINTSTPTTDDLEDAKTLSFDGIAFEHGYGVCPVVPYYNHVDLEGNPTGEIMPIIPTLRRIDQSTFDRLIVQRFGAWKVRYIAGMTPPETPQEGEAQKFKLSVADILVAEDPNTQFGTLDGTDTKGYIEATDHDLRVLAAITQTPPHHLLGLSSNLQAEALGAATEGLRAKSLDYRQMNSGSHEQTLRLIAIARGKMEDAIADEYIIEWRRNDPGLTQEAAQALATVSNDLGVPPQMMWEHMPGWTDADSERAKRIVESGEADRLIEMMAQAGAQQAGQQQEGQTGGNNAR